MAAAGVLAAVNMGASAYSGYEGMLESQQQAKNLLADSERQTGKLKEQNEKFSAEQEAMYLKSGVTLEGSPLLVLEETRRKGLEERNDLRASARREAYSLIKQGRMRLIGGLGSAAGTGASAASAAGGGGGNYSQQFRQGNLAADSRGGSRYATGYSD